MFDFLRIATAALRVRFGLLLTFQVRHFGLIALSFVAHKCCSFGKAEFLDFRCRVC